MQQPFETDLDESPEEAARLQQVAALTSLVVRRRKEAIDGRSRSGIETIWREDEDQYLGIDPGASLAPSKEQYGSAGGDQPVRSTIVLNITQPKTDAAEARVIDMMLPVDNKPWGLKPTPIPELAEMAQDQEAQYMLPNGQTVPAAEVAKLALDQAQQAADAHEKLIEDQFVDCNWAQKVRGLIRSAARLGTGVMKGPVPHVLQERSWQPMAGSNVYQMTKVDRLVPWCDNVDVWDFFPDPNCGEDIQRGSYVIERDYLTERMLRDLLRSADADGYIASEIAAALNEGPQRNNRTDRGDRRDSQRVDDETFEVWYYYGDIPKEDLQALGCGCLDDEGSELHVSAILTLVNDRIIKATINPLETGEFPYQVMPWDRVPGEIWGRGVPRKIAVPQRITTAAARALMDNAGLSVGPQILIDDMAVEPMDGKYEITGRKLWRFKIGGNARSAQEAMAVFTIPTMQAEISNIIEFGLRMADEVSGLPLLMQGERGSAPETVGGMQMLMQSASIVLKRLAKQFDDYYTRPALRAWYNWNMQHSDDEAIKGDLQIDARGASELAARDQANQFLMVAGQFVANPAFGIDPKKLFKEMAGANHFDARKIQFTDEEIQQQQQQPPAPPPQVAVAQIRAESEQAKLQFEAQENEKDRQFEAYMAQLDAELKQMEASGQQQISVANMRAKLADSAMKERSKQQLLAAELVHANQYGRGV